ncbi:MULTISPECIES: tannase/feruloyl esterase family alpha/beta hydrolase [unclassified Bradyrhizobium]|uniref:tannase/feruloyl esterase family alpha/beta hydrolase n=1 Tax=unclassified Bradyrhizobium TaxID=2631580 RepID=UPI0029169B82|nr:MULTISPECIES: tannase/feruloyl esterase family alpha/beta hydrolase [unclassified Bradyrhizobium]
MMMIASRLPGCTSRSGHAAREAFAGALAVMLLSASPGFAAPCEQLLILQIEDTTMSGAEARPAGSFAPPTGAEISELPAFCRVRGVISPVPGSRVGFELWLPQAGWNGKLEMVGNGGYSSAIAYKAMGPLLRRGYATVATDTGHTGDDPGFAIDRPEAIVDWGYRAVHVSIGVAKSVVAEFYGEAPKHSYFAGCSTGGHQALMEAQRYPADFDGIIAGDPGNNRTHLNAGFLWQFVKNHRPDLSLIIPPLKLAAITDAVVKTCRGKDGGLPADNFLTDPEACDFRAEQMLCKQDDADDCLTQEQANALNAMYDGARDSRNGAQVYYGWPKGSENSARVLAALPGWSLYWADPIHPERPARLNFWKVWAFPDTNWDWHRFDFGSAMKAVDDRLASEINAMSPDLSAFKAAGGKLIHYHGLADPVVPPRDSIDYYERVEAMVSADKRADAGADFYRLFLAPGLYHCEGGPGPNVLDTQVALEAWVENGEAPETIGATKFRNDRPSDGIEMSRPLCPYPKMARYRGEGDPADAANYACADGHRYAVPLPAAAYLR